MPELSAYILVGPTAVGKSSAAHHLAKKHGYEILSADSMQVYSGMDIGTAKATLPERSEVIYHGIDIATPDREFSVADYRDHAVDVLKKAASKKKQVIITGGTGLYIKALVRGLSSGPKPDPESRKGLESIYKEKGIKGLQSVLMEISPEIYRQLKDPENPRRIIRAIEMARNGGDGIPVEWKSADDPVVAGISLAPEILRERIKSRVDGMYRNGLLEEAERLLGKYKGLSRTAMQAIGYAEAFACLRGELSQKEAQEITINRTNQYAKRQRTWFRHQANTAWIDIASESRIEQIAEKISKIWEQNGPARIKE